MGIGMSMGIGMWLDLGMEISMGMVAGSGICMYTCLSMGEVMGLHVYWLPYA